MKLVKYDAACRALAEAVRIDEVKDIRDKAIALSEYARRAKNGRMIADATAIRKHAERRLGELMEDDRKAGKLAKPTGGHRPKGQRVAKKPVVKTLADQGIDKNLADRARKSAAMSKDKFEQQVTQAVDAAVAAADGDTSVVKQMRKTRQDAKRKRRAEREHALGRKILALPDKLYGVIVADPEWQWEPWSHKTGMDRAAANHYPTSILPVIAARDVPSISAKDCVLFLWATGPMTPHALIVMAAWGFDYKAQHVWGKDKFGTGFWNREKHELLLIGTRGDVPCPAPGTQWDSLIMAPRGKHSEKPECFLEMIEQYFPNLPKIELNRRGPPRAGWDAWGNETQQMEAAE